MVTRSGEGKYQEVYQQMDKYVAVPRVAAVSLRSDSVGVYFWQEEFLRTVRAFLAEKQ